MNLRFASTVLLLAFTLTACDGAAPSEAPPAAKPVAADPTPKPHTEPSAPTVAPEAKPIAAAAVVGAPAPNFTLSDLEGKPVSLSDHLGKVVVLEWFNPGCPFVKYAHGEGPLKDLSARWLPKDIVWLAINSGAPGKQGHGTEANLGAAKEWSMTHPILLDESGEVGRSYGARTTPQMFVVDSKGVLVYAGALDNAPIGEVDGGGARVTYFEDALAATLAGTAIPLAEKKSYGCSVKYAS